ncbi:sorbosone dehydrogenase family protein [Sporosarcina sp. Te-1]|uniref:PQQ-dependent sugar dehydrogenase n=1 Tax=Sporosarcina sp. Te-1 TaxID=2818390 RepID=UPI001A9FF6F9|nr:PQQ-dependent sugar dehydrogenase [Sporosarcina sp. Te-1]QTD40358.1 PQQ-dependent sugar dehydrogenase [Sporosarcina sp. Te-1]
MKRYYYLFIVFILFGCTQGYTQENQVDILATGLAAPWSITSDGNTIFISERAGTITRVDQDGSMQRQPVRLSKPLSTVAEAGLLGFVLSPDFDSSHSAYAFYTADLDGTPSSRIVTLYYDGAMWNEQEVLLDGVESGPVHHGGRLAISPDVVLFATVGDGARPEEAQNPSTFNGKILTRQQDGTFRIFTMGHRNPQGLAWDAKGNLYSSEHGQSANDEINLIQEGVNYGWPLIEGTETAPGMQPPLLTSGREETWAPSGMVFHHHLLYVAALRGERILVIDVTKGEIVRSIEGYGRIRDLYSDGEYLYFITNNTDGRGNPRKDDDKLYRFKPD